ncbi:hypothetical protein HYT84_01040, partial [Candidatus Micrarchaeota archaeon]|nr:hypothetical protein [Candidatus Micrarchaeota archaeon]
MKYVYVLLLFFAFFGCVTIQLDVTQNFYFDGTSKIDYYEALMPTPDLLHDTYHYFKIYKNPFLLPFNKVAPEVFAKRPYVICDLLDNNGVQCNVEKTKKKLKGEDSAYNVELDGYKSEMTVKQGEDFKMTKVEDNINLMDIYTYEIYKVPTPLSNFLKTRKHLETDLEEEMKKEAAASLYEAYQNGVCISYSKLISDCDVINLEEKITVSIDPEIDDFRK